MPRLLALVCLALLPGCQSPAARWEAGGLLEPLEILDRRPLEYQGELSARPPAPRSRAWEGPILKEGAPLPPQVELRMRLLALDPEVAARLLPGFPVQGARVVRVPAAGLEERLEALVAAGAAEEIQAPSVLAYSGQEATLSILSQLAYLDRFDLKRGEAGALADPHVATAEDGLVLRVRPDWDPAAARLKVQVSLDLRELVRPVPEHRIEILPDAPLTIQVPITRRQELRGEVTLHEGEAAILGTLQDAEPGRILLLVLSGRPLPEEESAREPVPPTGEA